MSFLTKRYGTNHPERAASLSDVAAVTAAAGLAASLAGEDTSVSADAGPQGQRGLAGANGRDGTSGIDGQDGEDGQMMFVSPATQLFALSAMTPPAHVLVTAGYSAIIQRSLTIPSGIKVAVGSGGRLRIL